MRSSDMFSRRSLSLSLIVSFLELVLVRGQSPVCEMKLGSYRCLCPPGEALKYALIRGGIVASCIRPTTGTKLSAGIILLIAVACAIIILLVLLGAIHLKNKLKARKAKKLKERNFKKNRGMLLEKLIDKDIAERMIFSLDELEKATGSFDESHRLGGGAHADVYKGLLTDQRVVAIKKSKVILQREIKDFINEIAILCTINHRNIVCLLGCCLETEVPLLVYEFVSKGTVSQHLHVDGTSLSWVQRLGIAAGTANAISYLHWSASKEVVHRDLKSENILLDETVTPKLSDFGASRMIPSENTGSETAVQGTYGYLDPEYCQSGRLTKKSDVYSFGALLLELLTRRKPSLILESEQIAIISHFHSLVNLGKVHQILDPQVIAEAGKEAETVAEIAASCLSATGDERPNMRQIEAKLQELLPTRSSRVIAEHVDDDVGDSEQGDFPGNEDNNVKFEPTNIESGSGIQRSVSRTVNCDDVGQRTLSLREAEAALALSLREAEAAFAKRVAGKKLRKILQDKEFLRVKDSGLPTLNERKADANLGVQVLADSEEDWHSLENNDDYSGDSGANSDGLSQDHTMKSVEIEEAAFGIETLTTVQKMESRSDEEEDDDDDHQLWKSGKLSLKKGIGSEANTERMSRGDVNLQLLNPAEQKKLLKKQKKCGLQCREEETLAKLQKFKASFLSNKPANMETKAEDGEGYKEWHANRLTFSPESSKDGMKVDPLLEQEKEKFNPLLEKEKQKFNKMQAKLKKGDPEWPGRSLT